MVSKCHRTQTFMLLHLTRCHKSLAGGIRAGFCHPLYQEVLCCMILQTGHVRCKSVTRFYHHVPLLFHMLLTHCASTQLFLWRFKQSVLSQGSHTACDNLHQANTSDTFTKKRHSTIEHGEHVILLVWCLIAICGTGRDCIAFGNSTLNCVIREEMKALAKVREARLQR